MKTSFIQIFFVTLFIVGLTVVSFMQLKQSITYVLFNNTTSQDYQEPALPVANKGTWQIESIDTQIVSKNWPNINRDSVHEQVSMIQALGPNYVAIATPYDNLRDMRVWVDEIHKAGMHVWFRSHWNQWEGDNGQPDSMSPQAYITKTSEFIKNNPDLFKPGDSFTMTAEPEQVGVGLGKKFLTWDDYRNFLLSEITVSNDSFKAIHLNGKIYTNWLSVNGWVVENEFTSSLMDHIGLIVVDHYVYQSKTIGDFSDASNIVNETSRDLDSFYNKWHKPLILGEWGYQIYQEAPEDIQASVIDRMYAMLKTKPYLVGVNYWAHMGNSAHLINDIYGSHLTYRKAAYVIQNYFRPSTPTLSPTSTQ